jgi:hypothetical protein
MVDVVSWLVSLASVRRFMAIVVVSQHTQTVNSLLRVKIKNIKNIKYKKEKNKTKKPDVLTLYCVMSS